MSALLSDDTEFAKLKELLTNVGLDVAPGQRVDFDTARSAILTARAHRGGLRTMPGLVEAGLLSLHLISGTLAVIEIYRTRKIKTEDLEFERELRNEWIKALVAAGMSNEMARLVPLKRCADVIRFMATIRMRSAVEPDQ
jgi:hypothetical protein